MHLYRRPAELKYLMSIEKVACGILICRKSEFSNRAEHPRNVVGFGTDKNIQIASESRSAVKATGYPLTMRKSTFFAINKEQRSATSWWKSIAVQVEGYHVLPP
jgi:hypothetical protein